MSARRAESFVQNRAHASFGVLTSTSDTEGFAALFGEESRFTALLGSIMLFFGFGAEDVRDRSYTVQIYSLLRSFGILEPLVRF